jgi:hypothetical protein
VSCHHFSPPLLIENPDSRLFLWRILNCAYAKMSSTRMHKAKAQGARKDEKPLLKGYYHIFKRPLSFWS